MSTIEDIPGGVRIKVRVQPRASKNELAGMWGDYLKVRLTAPPVEGAANRQCEEFFAGLLKVPKSSVRVVAGNTGRNKTVEIQGITGARVRKLLKTDTL
ncbi:DUF167 domain-containing protein [Calderihabitans maritimus]|uniref:UPF0235 protein KKC1_17420 n=1 Tax=Calderihabitans maritimus TaxID=1246530 RepID=A0A1Z5HTE1_9FIRM|nr:DUF167 domain-containing protein [Calderihabitans maritimus]GAW92591.1 uncharacterized conserved protein yggY [Calderihabitans maritimus]